MIEGMTAWSDLTDLQARRWEHVLDLLASVLAGVSRTVIDGHDPAACAVFADRLATAVRGQGRRCVRLTADNPAAGQDQSALTIADGRIWRSHPAFHAGVVVWLRAPVIAGSPAGHRDSDAAVVIDLRDPDWPVIRHIDAALAGYDRWYRTESQAFFGIRAAGWDAKFGDDMPAYAAAIAEATIRPGDTVVDLGCGTGRALPALCEAVGPTGTVIGIDHTREMLAVARSTGRARSAVLIQADARHLPLRDLAADGVFAAGLITHLPDVHAGLSELARVTKPGGALILFHPSGRVALAARHNHPLRPGDPLDKDLLAAALNAAGWRLTSYDDPPHRFLAVAERTGRISQ